VPGEYEMNASSEPAQEDRALFTWVHVSDIHQEGDEPYERHRLLSELKRDVREYPRKSGIPQPDAILVTGNAALPATREEYDKTAKWLRELSESAGITPIRVFVVPGEGDVDPDWDRIPATRRLVRDLRDPKHKEDKIDHALGNKDERRLLVERMAKFVEFSKVVMPDVVKYEQDGLCWSCGFWMRDGLRVRLAGLNTALLCAADEMSGGYYLGLGQLVTALAATSKSQGDLVVALSHFPFEGGKLTDERDVQPWIRRHTHVQLSGCRDSTHDCAFGGTSAGIHFLQLSAGLHGKLPHDYVYWFASVIHHADGTLTLRTWPRRWSHKNTRFQQDQDNLKDGQAFSEHELHGEWPGINEACTVRFEWHETTIYQATAIPGPTVQGSQEDAEPIHTYYVTLYRDKERLQESEWHNGLFFADLWSHESDNVPHDVRKRLLFDLDIKDTSHGELCAVLEEAREGTKHIYGITLDRGRVRVKRDDDQTADVYWRDGHIEDDRNELLYAFGCDKQRIDTFRQKLQTELLKLYEN
jgi:hypothetical protein